MAGLGDLDGRTALGPFGDCYQVLGDPGGPMSIGTSGDTSTTPAIDRSLLTVSSPASPVMLPISSSTCPMEKPASLRSLVISVIGRSGEVVTIHTLLSGMTHLPWS